MRSLAKLLGTVSWWIGKWGTIVWLGSYFATFFQSLADGLTVLQSIVWAFFAMAIAGFVLLVVAKWLDYLADLTAEMMQRRKAAKFFKDMALHGKHEAISLSDAVYFWNGGKFAISPMERIEADFKLHHLKAAIGQRFLIAQGPGGVVTVNAMCKPSDLADFFGSFRWIFVKDELWREATYEGQAQ